MTQNQGSELIWDGSVDSNADPNTSCRALGPLQSSHEEAVASHSLAVTKKALECLCSHLIGSSAGRLGLGPGSSLRGLCPSA